MNLCEKNGPLVSVITGTYNRPNLLKLALASTLAGSYHNFELIVSDNANSQENRAIAASFGDPRIRYRANPVNLGIAANYRAAFRELKGKYFAVLADDDLWEPDFLSRTVPVLESDSRIAVAFTDHFIIDDDGTIDFERSASESAQFGRDRLSEGISRPLIELGLLSVSIHAGAAAVFRSSSIDWNDFPLEVGGAFDLWLSYLAASSGGLAYYVPERLTRYRVHSGSGHHVGFAEVARERTFVYSRAIADGKFPGYRNEFARRRGTSHVDCGGALLRMGRIVEGGRHLLLGIADPAGLSHLVAICVRRQSRRPRRGRPDSHGAITTLHGVEHGEPHDA
jgi:glycosyltransferase involved in cell wall biosynthesis